jgi:hypothetical protein
MSDATSELSPGDPSTEGPKGIGGFLVLPILGLLLSGFLGLASLISLITPDTWSMVTLLVQGHLQDELVGFVVVSVFEVVSIIALLFLNAWCLVAIFNERRNVPTLMAVFYGGSLALALIDLLALSQMPPDVVTKADQFDAMRDFMRAVVAAAIWIPYFLVSKRVKNTFVH